MKQKPLFIAFSTQKGGAGKSTFTALASSLLHYAHGYNVAVIDCDYPQCSIYEMRKREIRQLENNLYYQAKAVTLLEAIDHVFHKKDAYIDAMEHSKVTNSIETIMGLIREASSHK